MLSAYCNIASLFPGSLSRQPFPAAFPGSLAPQPCPSALPLSLARQPFFIMHILWVTPFSGVYSRTADPHLFLINIQNSFEL
jgi:hypothetical protein